MIRAESSLLYETYLKDQLPTLWLEKLYTQGYFKLFVPRKYGGLELSLSDGLEKIFQAGSVHGSLGWSVNLGAGAGFFWSFFEDDVAKELFEPANAVISGSGLATGSFDGKTVTGRWDKCTGAGYATWFTANARKEDGSICSFAIPRERVTIKPAWDLFALKATSSYAIELDGVEVPKGHIFNIGKTRNSYGSYPISKVPFEPFARLCMLAAFLGMVDCLSKHLLREQSEHEEITSFADSLRDKVNGYRVQMLKDAEKIYRENDKNLTMNIGEISKSIFILSNELFYYHGMRLANEKTLAHFAWRDIILATQHFLLR